MYTFNTAILMHLIHTFIACLPGAGCGVKAWGSHNAEQNRRLLFYLHGAMGCGGRQTMQPVRRWKTVTQIRCAMGVQSCQGGGLPEGNDFELSCERRIRNSKARNF